MTESLSDNAFAPYPQTCDPWADHLQGRTHPFPLEMSSVYNADGSEMKVYPEAAIRQARMDLYQLAYEQGLRVLVSFKVGPGESKLQVGPAWLVNPAEPQTPLAFHWIGIGEHLGSDHAKALSMLASA